MSSNAKYIIVAMILAIGTIGISFYSCEKEVITPNETTEPSGTRELEETPDNSLKTGDDITDGDKFVLPQDVCGEATIQRILTSEGKPVGKAYCYNGKEFFHLMLVASEEFVIGNAYFQNVLDRNKIPLDESGNPDFKQFKHTIHDEEFASLRTFRVPISEFSGQTLITAVGEFKAKRSSNPDADAKVFTAWVDGKQYGNTLFGRVFSYTKGVCLTDEPTGDLADE